MEKSAPGFKIWLDADSCPAVVRKLILKNAYSNNVPVVFVANRKIQFDFESDLFSMVVCPNESGAADEYIYQNIGWEDMAVTRDLPLASRLMEKCGSVMNDRGTLFDEKTIRYMLEEREVSMQMSALGIRPGGNFKEYSSPDAKKFADCFCPLLRKKCGKV